MTEKKAVIVFVFTEDESMPHILARAKGSFEGIPEVKIFAAINKSANRVISVFERLKR